MDKECNECKKMYKLGDFLGGSANPDVCYKCLYAKKVSKVTPKKPKCKVCLNDLPKGFWAYCGPECASIGAAEQKRKYWTKEIPSNCFMWA